MTIENKSGKVIGIDGKAILPGETGVIPDSYKTNGILGVLAKDPDLTIKHTSDSTASIEGKAAAMQAEQSHAEQPDAEQAAAGQAAPKTGKSAAQTAKADEKG